jgi:hypothetical protein
MISSTMGDDAVRGPRPGDLIVVARSRWYALPDGERLRVCESAGWAIDGEEIFVAPRKQVSTFWGPCHGPPDGEKPETMSTSGGPFLTLRLGELEGLQAIGRERDRFWCWQDRPRAGGGVDRIVEVTIWHLPELRDPYERSCEVST